MRADWPASKRSLNVSSAKGGASAYARTDVTRRQDLADLVRLACERFGKLDVRVNNAGIAPLSLLDSLRVDDGDGLRQEAGDTLRVTIVSPGYVDTNLADSMTDPVIKARVIESQDRLAIPPEAIGRAIAFAIEQPANVDVNEIVVRLTAQG